MRGRKARPRSSSIHESAAAVAGAALLAVAIVTAQEPPRPTPAPPPADILERRVVYRVPGMDKVGIRRDLAFKTAEGAELKMDVYLPARQAPAKRRPVVVFIHGGPIQPEMRPKEWGVYRSYGEIVAASGLVGVTFNHRLYGVGDYERSAGDVAAVVDHVRRNASSFQADPDRLAVWAFSGGGPLLSFVFQSPPPFVRCAVSYYAILDVREPAAGGAGAAGKEEAARKLSPAYLVQAGTGPLPPVLIARAGLDSPRINQSVDEFLRGAFSRGLTVDLLTVPEGRHGFDILDDHERSREVIKRTIEFLRTHLSAN